MHERHSNPFFSPRKCFKEYVWKVKQCTSNIHMNYVAYGEVLSLCRQFSKILFSLIIFIAYLSMCMANSVLNGQMGSGTGGYPFRYKVFAHVGNLPEPILQWAHPYLNYNAYIYIYVNAWSFQICKSNNFFSLLVLTFIFIHSFVCIWFYTVLIMYDSCS